MVLVTVNVQLNWAAYFDCLAPKVSCTSLAFLRSSTEPKLVARGFLPLKIGEDGLASQNFRVLHYDVSH